jgi:hypothetical protein
MEPKWKMKQLVSKLAQPIIGLRHCGFGQGVGLARSFLKEMNNATCVHEKVSLTGSMRLTPSRQSYNSACCKEEPCAHDGKERRAIHHHA